MPYFSFNKQFYQKKQAPKTTPKTRPKTTLNNPQTYKLSRAERNELLDTYPKQKTYKLSQNERSLLNNINLDIKEISQVTRAKKPLKKRAVLAGINYVKTPKSRLNGCVNDVLTMEKVLTSKYGYNTEDLTLLRDDVDDNSKWPTHKNIIESLTSVVKESEHLDEIWFHYSGHGASVPDRNHDETDGKDEVLIPSDYKTNGVILDDTLFKIFAKANCPVILTIDCCHSGTISDLPYSFYPNPLNKNNFSRVVQNNRAMKNKNIYMFSGCRDDQTSADVEYYKNNQKINEGAFTSALVESLRYHNHHVTLIQLYVTILEVLKSRGYTQRTVFSSSNPEPHVTLTCD